MEIPTNVIANCTAVKCYSNIIYLVLIILVTKIISFLSLYLLDPIKYLTLNPWVGTNQLHDDNDKFKNKSLE
jgi:hypothetical protein